MPNFNDPKALEFIAALGGILPEKQFSTYRYDFQYDDCPMIVEVVGKMYKISYLYPNHNRNANNYKPEQAWENLTQSIKVAKDRSVEQIIKSIKNRLDIQAYKQVVKLFQEASDNHEKYQKNHTELAAKIAEAIGQMAMPRTRKNDAHTEISIYKAGAMYGDIKIEGTSVDFHIRGLNATTNFDFIVNIAKLIAEQK